MTLYRAIHQEYRKNIEPWLAAIFQSEHLSLLLGNGFTLAVAASLGAKGVPMEPIGVEHQLKDKIIRSSAEVAERGIRGDNNLENQLDTAIQLIRGLQILGEAAADSLKKQSTESCCSS